MPADRSVADHLSALLASVAPLPAVGAAPVDAVGRVLAEDVVAPLDLPRFDHAAMDGFAVHADDVVADAELPVVGAVGAGDAAAPLEPGTAVRIMTGAPMPPGANAVVPFEATEQPAHDRVRWTGPVAAGAHIRRRGEDVRAGCVLEPAGMVLTPRLAGLAAGTGVDTVRIRTRPRVVVLTTGSELVPAGTDPDHLRPGALHDSTAVTLVAELRALGVDASHRGPVGDDVESFLVLLHEAVRAADLVVTTGGISAGDHDVVKAALKDREHFWFGRVALRPGRPQGHGHLVVDGERGRRVVPVIALPGTPAASYLTFGLFVRPVLAALAGNPALTGRVSVALAAPVRRSTDRTALVPAAYDGDGRARALPGHAGHSQRLVAAADLVLVVPPGTDALDEGARIKAIVPEGGPR